MELRDQRIAVLRTRFSTREWPGGIQLRQNIHMAVDPMISRRSTSSTKFAIFPGATINRGAPPAQIADVTPLTRPDERTNPHPAGGSSPPGSLQHFEVRLELLAFALPMATRKRIWTFGPKTTSFLRRTKICNSP
jgi:hypothetical protein